MSEYDDQTSSDSDEIDALIPSKTSIKKAMLELQHIAEELLNTPPKKLNQLPLSEIVCREIELGKRLPSSNSRRRQVQRIAKILRSENIQEIANALSDKQLNDRKQQQSIGTTQQWSEKLIDNGKETLSEFIKHYPNTNVQQLGQCIRHAKKEKNDEKNTSNKYQQRLFTTVQKILTE